MSDTLRILLSSSRLRAFVIGVLTVACGSSEGEPTPSPEPDPDPGGLDPEVDFLYWVDPARCLTPCTGDPSTHLVRVAINGTIGDWEELYFERRAQPALAAFIAGATEAGHGVSVSSPFRTYETQVELWVDTLEIGRAARPGHSEHQIGTAVDLSYGTPEGESWLAEHAFEYGFALSFPPGTEKLSGIRYEPWHFRYVGDDAALEIHENGWAIVEYLMAHPERARSGDCGDCPASESNQSCDGLEWSGVCDGTVVRWCLDGAAGAVDCASTGLTCSVDAAGEADCR